MISKIASIAAIAVAISGSAAVAGESRRMKSADGVIVTHRPANDSYCIRVSSETQSKRLGMPLHATECHSKANWAREGLTISRRSELANRVALAE